MKAKQVIQKVIDYGLLITIIVFPLSMNIALVSLQDFSHPLIAINISLADLLIGGLFLLWGVNIYISKEWRQIKLPPFPILIFLAIGVLSFVNAFLLSQWAKEIIQMIEYFLLFYLLLCNNLRTVRLTAFKNALFFSSSIILFIALIQFLLINEDLYLVRGLFPNRNIMGTFLCISFPFIYVELLHSKNIFRKMWMLVLIILTILVLTSGSAILSILVSLVTISWLWGRKIFVRFLLIFLPIVVLYSFVLPQNIKALKGFTSIYEQGSIRENYYNRLRMLRNASKTALYKKEMGQNVLLITIANFLDVDYPDFEKGDKYKEMEGTRHIKNRYLEMQASINMLSENTLLGVGLGNFQNQVGTFYYELPKVNTAEPNQNNGYLIVGSTMGIFGLASLIWIFISSIKNAYSNFKTTSYEKRGFYLSIFGGLIACGVENFFSMLFISALMVPFVVLLFLSYSELE